MSASRSRSRERRKQKRRDSSPVSESEDEAFVMPTGANFKDFQDLLKAHEEKSKKRKKSGRRKVAAGHKPIISMEDVREMAVKAKDEEKLQKPVFISKKEREELALKRLEEKRRAETNKDADIKTQRRTFERAVADDRKKYRRERDPTRKAEREQSKTERDESKRLQLIKEDYIGRAKDKKRFIPPSQKFKFSFDWEATEDTSIELDPLYNKKHQPALMFGRGFLGGQDRREQRKAESSRFYDELIQNREDQDTAAEPVVEVVAKHDPLLPFTELTGQRVLWLDETAKQDKLTAALRVMDGQVLVFCATKNGARMACRNLVAEGFTCGVVHKDMGNADRDAALTEFLSSQVRVLVTTDCLGAGVDTPGVSLVINYDLPRTLAKYKARVVRSGGRALSFVTDLDADLLKEFAEYLADEEGQDAIPLGMKEFLKQQEPQGPMLPPSE